MFILCQNCWTNLNCSITCFLSPKINTKTSFLRLRSEITPVKVMISVFLSMDHDFDWSNVEILFIYFYVNGGSKWRQKRTKERKIRQGFWKVAFFFLSSFFVGFSHVCLIWVMFFGPNLVVFFWGFQRFWVLGILNGSWLYLSTSYFGFFYLLRVKNVSM